MFMAGMYYFVANVNQRISTPFSNPEYKYIHEKLFFGWLKPYEGNSYCCTCINES